MGEIQPVGLKRCPNRWCASHKTGRDRVERVYDGLESYWVRCAACFLEGPTATTERQADFLWDYLPRLEGAEGPDAKALLGARP